MHFIKQTLIPHRHNSYRPHLIRRHGLAFALLLVLGVQVVSGLQVHKVRGSVLGYASNISISGLLSATNSERAAAGKSSLKINSKLNAAAQGKANHMITNNYWAHTSPNGVTPWYWFDWAGYDYLVAGENLAYGFDTSNGVVNGWMNSPSHRDNMLNAAFEEVGFGIANGDNYQGGPNTVVVAHYADPAVLSQETEPEPAPSGGSSGNDAPTPSQPADPAPAPTSTPVEATEQEAEEPQEEAEKKSDETKDDQDDVFLVSKTDIDGELEVKTELAPSTGKRISNIQAILTGQAGWALYVTSLIAISIGFVYAYRHVLFLHKVVLKGEEFIVSHPMLEASIIYALVWLLLTSSFGNVL